MLTRGVLLLAAIGLVVALNLTPIYTSDFWLQLKVGELIRESGSIPTTILFACTEARDFEFVAHEWLPSVLSSLLFAHVGYAGMIVFKCALALLLFALILLLVWRVGGSFVVGTIVAAFVLLTINFRTHMRPELFAFLLFVVALILLHEFLVSGRLRWLVGLLPVGLVWANTHGSFLVGLGLIPMVLAGLLLDDWRNGELGDPLRRRTRIRRRYLPLAAAALLLVGVSLITPHGVELFRQAFVIGQADFIRENILEFAPTFGEQMRGRLYVKIYVVFLSVVALSFAVARKRVSAVSVVLFVVFGYLSVDAVRYTAWFAVASAYVLARNLRGAPSKRDSRTALAVIASLVLLGSVATVLERGNVMGKPLGFEDMSPLPSEAIEFIEREGIQGNVFNAYRFGDQLVYQFYPRIRVVIDSRNDAYGERYYLQYRSLSGRSFKRLAPAEELVGFLDRYRIDTIVTLPHDFRNWEAKGYLPPLERAGWEVTFDRSDTLVLQRRGAAP